MRALRRWGCRACVFFAGVARDWRDYAYHQWLVQGDMGDNQPAHVSRGVHSHAVPYTDWHAVRVCGHG